MSLKNINKIFIPKKIFIFLNPSPPPSPPPPKKNIEIQNFVPPKKDPSLCMYENITERVSALGMGLHTQSSALHHCALSCKFLS